MCTNAHKSCVLIVLFGFLDQIMTCDNLFAVHLISYITWLFISLLLLSGVPSLSLPPHSLSLSLSVLFSRWFLFHGVICCLNIFKFNSARHRDIIKWRILMLCMLPVLIREWLNARDTFNGSRMLCPQYLFLIVAKFCALYSCYFDFIKWFYFFLFSDLCFEIHFNRAAYALSFVFTRITPSSPGCNALLKV